MPETPQDLAGEFVLGALEDDERAAVERRMREEPAFRRSVELWSRYLMPLLDRVAPVTPPAAVWLAVRERIGETTPTHSRWKSDGVWLDIVPGIRLKMLHVDPLTGERTGLMRMEPGSAFPEHDHRETEECFVLEGVVNIDGRDYGAGDYTIAYSGSRHEAIRSTPGGLLLLHWNALPPAA
jgi:anti-sigma factor ChrR (cupin superfamily)